MVCPCCEYCAWFVNNIHHTKINMGVFPWNALSPPPLSFADMNPPSMRSFATAVYLACGAFGAASSVIVGALNSIFGQEIDEGTDEEVVYDPTAALLVMTSGMYVLSGSCFIALGFFSFFLVIFFLILF